MIKRITKKQIIGPKNFAMELLRKLQIKLSSKYKFTYRLVGSCKWNTVIKDENGFFDLDFQILLTKNSNEFKNNKLSKASEVKEDFFNEISKQFSNEKHICVENSTTAITVINKIEKYSIDIVIIKLFPDNHEIIRRNNKVNSSINEYTWNKLPKYNLAYNKFNNLNNDDKMDLIQNYILPRKIKEKKKSDNDKTKKSSSEVFIEEVNKYAARK